MKRFNNISFEHHFTCPSAEFSVRAHICELYAALLYRYGKLLRDAGLAGNEAEIKHYGSILAVGTTAVQTIIDAELYDERYTKEGASQEEHLTFACASKLTGVWLCLEELEDEFPEVLKDADIAPHINETKAAIISGFESIGLNMEQCFDLIRKADFSNFTDNKDEPQS